MSTTTWRHLFTMDWTKTTTNTHSLSELKVCTGMEHAQSIESHMENRPKIYLVNFQYII